MSAQRVGSPITTAAKSRAPVRQQLSCYRLLTRQSVFGNKNPPRSRSGVDTCLRDFNMEAFLDVEALP
jgi:hypothetical protein